METVSVLEAVKRGKIMLTVTPVCLFFIMLIIQMFMLTNLLIDGVWVAAWAIGGYALAFLIPFIYYLKMLPTWRIWAFENVRNVHELKQIANLAQIYPKDKSFLWKIEIKTTAQKDKIAELDRKFDIPDIFEDDYTIPVEKSYSFNKIENLFYLLLAFAGIAGTIYCLYLNELVIGIISLVAATIFGALFYVRFNNSSPLLVLNNDGITTKKFGFHSWHDIVNEHLIYVRAGKASYYALLYEANGIEYKLYLREISGLSSYKIEHYLRIYRGRYENAKSSRRSTPPFPIANPIQPV